MPSQEVTLRRDAVLGTVLTALIALSAVTAVVQLTAQSEIAWIGVNALVGLTFAGMRLAARAGHQRPVAVALIVLFGALTIMLLLTDGPDHPMWAILSAFTLALATMVVGGRGAIATLCAGAVIVLPIVVLQDAGRLDPLVPDEDANVTVTVVEMLILLAVIGFIVRVYMGAVLAPPAPAPTPDLERVRTAELTPREVEVVRLIAEGRSNDAIAAQLVVSPRTVHTHVTNAMRKCGCGNRTELGVLAVREGLVPLRTAPEPATARTP